jgi:hypothetical protein
MKPILAPNLLQLLELERIEDNIFRGEPQTAAASGCSAGAGARASADGRELHGGLQQIAFAARVLFLAARRS